jgi:hypothetical protein
MAQSFMKDTLPGSGFFLDDLPGLIRQIQETASSSEKTLVLGVTLALLDLAEQHPPQFPDNVIVMETGGMKGRRREMVREEVHEILCRNLGVSAVHSEYGMTELTSQGYALSEGKFQLPPWMRVVLRDMTDPFSPPIQQRSGGINLIDLANIDTCAFLETQDIGRWDASTETFRVLGRYDHADLRGCNLMVASVF